MTKSRISAFVASVVCVSSAAVVSADTKVVGQVSASSSAYVIADSVKNRIGTSSVPYIEGDVVSTQEEGSATLQLVSGNATLVAAPNTSFQVVNSEAGEVAINQGAVELQAAQGYPVTFTSAAGAFAVSYTHLTLPTICSV